VDSAEEFLDCYGLGLFGLTREELILTRVVEPEPGQGPAYAFYDQVYVYGEEGIPVIGAGLSLTIGNGRGYPVKLASSRLHPSPGPYLRAPNIDQEEAVEHVREVFGEEPVSVEYIEPVVWPLGDEPVHAWRAFVRPVYRQGEPEYVIVSAVDGKLLRRQPLTHRFTDFTATATGQRPHDPAIPVECTGTSTGHALEYLTVHVVGDAYDETELTDADGEATFYDVPATFSVTASMENDWFRAIDSSNLDNVRAETGNQSTNDYVFTNDTFSRTEQMVNTWRWLHIARDAVISADSTYEIDREKVEAVCNISNNPDCGLVSYQRPNPQNPYPRILLWNSLEQPETPCEPSTRPPCTCGCTEDDEYFIWLQDFHINTIVVHEYGHHVQYLEYDDATSAPWKENIADGFSAIVTNESIMGEELCNCGSPYGFTRDLSTPDVRWPNFETEVYPNGRSMSGAYWDMKSALNDDDYSLAVLLHSIKAHPEHISPTIALHAVLIDDNSDINPNGDDNVANGSPNYEKINGAFRLHDLAASNVPYVDIDWSGGAPTDPSESSEEIEVAVTVDPGALTLVSTNPVQLRYRINPGAGAGGTWSATNMTYRTQEDDYHGTIPLSGHSVGDVIDFYVRVEVTTSPSRYTCFPTQAQFDWVDPQYAADVEERDYFSLVVTNGTRTEAFAEDLESNPSWDVTGDWDYGTTPLVALGETPGFDFPYDYDGSSPGEGPNCYFTGDPSPQPPSPTVWALTTSAFNLGGANAAVVSYATWVYIRGGEQTDDRFIVEIGDGSNWVEIDRVTPSGSDTTALQRWLRRRVNVPSGHLDDGRKLRFTTVHNGVGALEVAVDEVRVWGVHDE
jgi:hypothetical protein